VIRHFLRIEASRRKYYKKKEEILSWCRLFDEEMLARARCFADERDDTNPVLAYTVGTAKADYSKKIAFWNRECIKCAEIYTCGISPQMSSDIDAVRGNMLDFALGPAAKFPEFAEGAALPQENTVIIVVEQGKAGRKGAYELIDGAHRLVALCLGRVETVEAYVGHLKTEE
jgi:hypothetical protein